MTNTRKYSKQNMYRQTCFFRYLSQSYGPQCFYLTEPNNTLRHTKELCPEDAHLAQLFRKALSDIGCGNMDTINIYSTLLKHVDQPIDQAMLSFVDYAKELEARRKAREERDKSWLQLQSRFNGVVIGMSNQQRAGRYLDMNPDGFAIDVQLASGKYKTQFAFVQKHIEDLKLYVTETIQDSPNILKRIGNLDFYYLSDITLKRSSEVRFQFTVKPGIAAILDENRAKIDETDNYAT